MSKFIHEVRNNLDLEAAEIYMQEHPEKTTTEHLKEWSRNLRSRNNTLRPFFSKAARANGEWCSDIGEENLLINKLSDVAERLAFAPGSRDLRVAKIHRIALLLRAEERLSRLHTEALWKLNEAITFPEPTLPDEGLSRNLSLSD